MGYRHGSSHAMRDGVKSKKRHSPGGIGFLQDGDMKSPKFKY